MKNTALYLNNSNQWVFGNDKIHFKGSLTNQQELISLLLHEGIAAYDFTPAQIALSIITLIKKKNNIRLKVAIKESMTIIKGTYSYIIISESIVKKVYCVKNGVDLYVGLDYNQFLIGDEINKLLSRTNRVISLEDGMMAEIFEDGTCFFTDAEGQRLNKEYRNVIGREIVNPEDQIVNILKKELSGVIKNVFKKDLLSPAIN